MKPLRSMLIAAALAAGGAAQAAPPINLVIPTPPGGGTDGFFRMVARAAEPHLGASIIVNNVGGAGGSIGLNRVVRSAPDGTTVAAVWTNPITVAPHTLKVPYGLHDYTPILELSSTPYTLCTKPQFPANTAREFLDLLKRNPDKYTYGTDGPGGLAQIAAMRVFATQGIRQRDVPYKGAGETLLATLGNQVDIYVGSIPPILPHVESGQAKCFIVTQADKVALLPKAASLTDLGIPAQETVLWRALIVPNQTPQKVIDNITQAFIKAMDAPEVQKFLKDNAEKVHIYKQAELRQRIDAEYEAMGKIIQSLGVKGSN
ncbi:Bug family tripartite tricarboxylate transporter substrate binding protein [Bordetella genomosp. 13]|uniref:Bug family tripartite tricarboxylate transporter substrate binding protein n=1 Tax=Bordetella genomosp. 13 TaxID=463040 RepID=UPI0011A31198|nr:tripartite tricarboxylate transporter substrate binding protein [Bordetella genomosp. 13]